MPGGGALLLKNRNVALNGGCPVGQTFPLLAKHSMFRRLCSILLRCSRVTWVNVGWKLALLLFISANRVAQWLSVLRLPS